MRASHRSWYQRNKEKRQAYGRAYQTAYRYGLTLQERQAMLDAQGGVCALTHCDAPATELDHCHVTGRNRGLLCTNHNLGLGHFRDDPQLLLDAAAYLRDT